MLFWLFYKDLCLDRLWIKGYALNERLVAVHVVYRQYMRSAVRVNSKLWLITANPIRFNNAAQHW